MLTEEELDKFLRTDEAHAILRSMALFDTPEEMLRAALKHRWQIKVPSTMEASLDGDDITLRMSKEEAGKLKAILSKFVDLHIININRQSLFVQLDDLGVHCDPDVLELIKSICIEPIRI